MVHKVSFGQNVVLDHSSISLDDTVLDDFARVIEEVVIEEEYSIPVLHVVKRHMDQYPKERLQLVCSIVVLVWTFKKADRHELERRLDIRKSNCGTATMSEKLTL